MAKRRAKPRLDALVSFASLVRRRLHSAGGRRRKPVRLFVIKCSCTYKQWSPGRAGVWAPSWKRCVLDDSFDGEVAAERPRHRMKTIAFGVVVLCLGFCAQSDGQSGTITTIAGNGTPGFTGDGASAIFAEMRGPSSVAADASGNILVADSGNYRIRRVATTGNMSTVAGNGTTGFSGDGGPQPRRLYLCLSAWPWTHRGISSSLIVITTGSGRCRLTA
jgi:NHL repeat